MGSLSEKNGADDDDVILIEQEISMIDLTTPPSNTKSSLQEAETSNHLSTPKSSNEAPVKVRQPRANLASLLTRPHQSSEEQPVPGRNHLDDDDDVILVEKDVSIIDLSTPRKSSVDQYIRSVSPKNVLHESTGNAQDPKMCKFCRKEPISNMPQQTTCGLD
ncbi:hypothetical protein HA402_001973 [Bradysia odoriphaga]|nr:hypothetical protein HA402_001973 [Bradysia odoriphaga]